MVVKCEDCAARAGARAESAFGSAPLPGRTKCRCQPMHTAYTASGSFACRQKRENNPGITNQRTFRNSYEPTTTEEPTNKTHNNPAFPRAPGTESTGTGCGTPR